MKTLEQLQAAAGELWPDIEAHLSQLRGRIETLVREEGTSLAALRDQHAAALANQAAETDATRKAASESHASELAELTASHAEALAAKDAQLATQVDEAWNEIKAVATKHAAAITELEAQHAAELAAAVEAEGRAVHNRLDALVQAGQEAHAAGDLDALGKVLVAAYAHTSTARKAKLESDLAAAQAAATEIAAKIAAL